MDGNVQSNRPLTSARWRPSRCGLVNFYRYDQQEFHFHQGRLLLRGNNGTGKSRVLALQLPFLLDGEISPERVEPDCDRAKRFEWNLLMGRYDDRLGYTWIEFERIDEAGDKQYLTLGCGVRAASGRGVVSKWFFTTGLRVGVDLSLCSSQNNPLPKDSLIEALGDRGKAFLTATTYREEVNRLLFGLSPQRYEALVELLIKLRQPKLSREFNEKEFSDAMSDALTPVRPEMILQVADAMRTMELDRQALRNLQSAKDSTDGFLVEYRRYAQIIAIQRSEQVRKSHSDYERCQRRLREAEDEHDSAMKESVQLKSNEAEIASEIAAARERRRTLESSPEMKSARELDDARRQSHSRQADADRAAAQHRDSTKLLERYQAEYQKHSDQLDSATRQLDEQADESGRLAAACEMSKMHSSAIARAHFPRPEVEASVAAADLMEARAVQNCVSSIRLLREINAKVEETRKMWKQSVDRRDTQASRIDETSADCRKCRAVLAQALGDLRRDYHQWHGSVVHLTAADPVTVSADIDAWFDENMSIASPVQRAVDQALGAYRQQAASNRAAIMAQRSTYQEVLAVLTAERDRLEQGQHQPPPTPYIRDPQARAAQAGAALRQLCEFADHVSPADRAGLEAALESAGILDAWIYPDGTFDGPVACDTILRGGGTAVTGPTLLDMVRPVWPGNDTPPVALAMVASILDRIALGESDEHNWVSADGRWQLGPLAGRWHKPSAEHIGQVARQAARLRRLQQLEDEIAAAKGDLTRANESLVDLVSRLNAAESEARSAPTDRAILQAVAERDASQRQLESEQERLTEMNALVERDNNALQDKIIQRDATATDLGLLSWVDRLQQLEDALNDYRQALAALWPAAKAFILSTQAFADARRRLEEEKTRAAQLVEASRKAVENARAAEARYQTLSATTGGAVQEIQRQLQQAVDVLNALDRDKSNNAKSLGQIEERIQQSSKTVVDLTARINQEISRRDAAIERLRRFTSCGLIDLTDDSLVGFGRGEMSATSAVELARRIDAALAGHIADDKASASTQRLIHNHIQNLTNTLHAHNYRPETITEDDTIVVTVQDQAERLSMREFGTKLSDEIVQRRTLLSAKELELLENYLIHDVAVELGKLIREGEELVTRMNRQLARRPNSTGLTLRFNWQPDPEGPQTFIEARKKLMGDYATWSPDDRTALGRFLQEQINRTREADTTGTWQEHLAAALDYRRWHTFHVERRQDDKKWVRLTKKTHGTGSGGEKAVALTIPQFAAAAAYYDTALPTAPRLILLDEAFVGIDRDMRGKCMGLLHEFDLDLVMTSEIEWGCYATIPGLAIYQLSAREGIDAVWVSRWVWNGLERVQDSSPGIVLNGQSHDAENLFGHQQRNTAQ